MFITNNKILFHLWRMKNLVKHEKISKYYDQDCLKNILLPFMSSLRAPIFKSSLFLVQIFITFLKIHPNSNFKGIQYQI